MRANKPTILPRISGHNGGSSYAYAYEALNGGSMQNSWRTIWAWRRFILGGFLLVILAWLGFGASRTTEIVGEDYAPRPDLEFEIPRPDTTHVDKPGRPPTRPPPAHQDRPILTFELDPNPASTEQCKRPYMSANGKTKPLVQWALMIDAGSTGSRVHVYKFNNCQSSPTFEYEVFKQTRPGLSKFAKDPESAAKSLDSLMQEAERVVPQTLWKCTPVAVKATAGLRLLGHSESEAILEAVKHRLETKYHFAVVQNDGVVIMDGKDEGVYAWITANYLLNTLPLQPPKTSADRLSNVPYAVLDLGGASTQIVFKPSFDIDGDGVDDMQGLEEGEHKYDLHFAGQTHELYQHSYLGYGLMRARASVHRLVEFMASYSTNKSPAPNKGLGHGHAKGSEDEEEEDPEEEDEEEIANPCLARGTTRTIEVDIGRDGSSIMKNVTMNGGDIGNWSACNRVLELVLAKDAVCHLKPCSFNGVYQPSLLDSFPSGPILLLSYFYDRLAPLLTPIPKAVPGRKAVDPTEELSFPISLVKDLARAVCEGETSWARHQFPFASPDRDAPTKWGESEDLMEELKGRPEYCLDLSFMYALLRLGYEFGEKRHVRIGKQVKGTELGWCLGATLGLLGDVDFECRA
ncbi:hypothetical protein CPB86DRAFT_735439 [Serendipita vermifera]|nr:hypothetical protein CPB86DRAFT_735439 [Serendipita vermifera]